MHLPALLTTIAALVTATFPAAAAPKGAFDPIAAAYNATTGEYCVRRGWGHLTRHADRRVRAGECRSAAEWRKRGIEFEAVVGMNPRRRR